MALVKDVVCGMEIEPESAEATSAHNGVTYYFCAAGCKEAFDAEPAKYLSTGGGGPSRPWWRFWRR